MAATDRWVNETSRVLRTLTSRPAGRAPVQLPVQGAGPQVEDPLVGEQLAVAHVERLVVDQQPDQLAVGDVDDGLPGLGVAVARLGVRQRAQLVERVEVGAGQAVRLALVEVAAQPDVPVGQREDRLRLGQHVQVEPGLPDVPRLDRVGALTNHAEPRSGGEGRSRCGSAPAGRRRRAGRRGPSTTMSAPCGAQLVGLPDPVDADHEAEAAGPAGGHPGERVLEDGGLRRVDAEQPGAGEERVRGAVCRAAPRARATSPSTRASSSRLEPGGGDHLAAVGAGRDHGPAQPGGGWPPAGSRTEPG